MKRRETGRIVDRGRASVGKRHRQADSSWIQKEGMKRWMPGASPTVAAEADDGGLGQIVGGRNRRGLAFHHGERLACRPGPGVRGKAGFFGALVKCGYCTGSGCRWR